MPTKLVDLRAPDSARGLDTDRSSVADNQSDAGRASAQGDGAALDSARLSTTGDPTVNPGQSDPIRPPSVAGSRAPSVAGSRAPSVIGSDTGRLSTKMTPRNEPPKLAEASPSKGPLDTGRLSVKSDAGRADSSSGRRTPRPGGPTDASRTVLTSDFTRTLGVYDAVKAQTQAN
jgi:hypothetical protein